jgi:hypothetical protein
MDPPTETAGDVGRWWWDASWTPCEGARSRSGTTSSSSRCDSLRRKIDAGLARSRFGLVAISHSFFAKNWPQYELDGIVALEHAGRQRILPVRHNISKEEVLRYSPSLADRVALSTALYTAEEIASVIKGSGDAPS